MKKKFSFFMKSGGYFLVLTPRLPESSVKMNFRIITKNHAADSKIEFPQKIVLRADGTQESHPTAWELIACIRK